MPVFLAVSQRHAVSGEGTVGQSDTKHRVSGETAERKQANIDIADGDIFV